LFSRNVCKPDEETACREEIGSDEYWKGACDICEKKKQGDLTLHPRTNYIYNLYRLRRAGYPFCKTDLSCEDWLALGLIDELIETKRRIF
jgi:hypothetical protein